MTAFFKPNDEVSAMTPTDRRRMYRGQPPRFSDDQILAALRSGQLSPLPNRPDYTLDFPQLVRRLRQQQTKARMNEAMRSHALIMTQSLGA
jgi:hypothetical protein